MEQNNIDEINVCYLGVLAKIELLTDVTDGYVAGQVVNNIEKDILEVAAMYDIYADNTLDMFARRKQRLLDHVRRENTNVSLKEKINLLRKLRRKEEEFVNANS